MTFSEVKYYITNYLGVQQKTIVLKQKQIQITEATTTIQSYFRKNVIKTPKSIVVQIIVLIDNPQLGVICIC